MQLELKKIQTALGITFIYVTHDQEEALTMSDEVIVLNEGEIQQKGTPVDIYNEPKNALVADFIGESNIFDGIMKKDFLVNLGGLDYECLDKGFAPGEEVDVVIRPEDIKISRTSGTLVGEVKSVVFKGVHYEMIIEAVNFSWLAQNTMKLEVGEKVYIDIFPDDIDIMRKVAPHE